MADQNMQRAFQSMKRNPCDQISNFSPEEGSLLHAIHSPKFLKKDNQKGHDIEILDSPARKLSIVGSSAFSGSMNYKYERYKKYSELEITDQLLAEKEAVDHCSKRLQLKDPDDLKHLQWRLPPVDELFTHCCWKEEDLQLLKDELNNSKSSLDGFELNEWHEHTKNINPAYKIHPAVKYKARPELLTQAFFKFYEILNAYPIIPEDEKFFSVHLCEAPGAFVVALNHYLALNRPSIDWSWAGNTLNPYYEGTPSSECISDDRFIYHTENNWFFGQNGTGDITDREYMKDFVQLYRPKGVSLVTADGSVDCQKDPSEQERNTHFLHSSEVYLALSVLQDGGSFVIKKFTFFECCSINLLYLIACTFREVHIYKPTTSKLGNSEVYVIALSYQPSDECREVLTKLQDNKPDKVLFARHHIPESFMKATKNISIFFKEHQIRAIKLNIDLFHCRIERKLQYCELLKDKVLQLFLDSNPCLPIPLGRRIVQQTLSWDKMMFPHPSSFMKWGGQIYKRPKMARLSFFNDRLEQLTQSYLKYLPQDFAEEKIHSLVIKEFPFNVSKGKPFYFVYISRFSDSNINRLFVNYFMECSSCDVNAQNYILHNEPMWLKYYESYDTKLQEDLRLLHPEAIMLSEGCFPGPNGKCAPIEEALDLLHEGNISTTSEIVFTQVQLLTRLQVGLFLALCSAFKSVHFHLRKDFKQVSYIVLRGLVSPDVGKRLLSSLEEAGWRRGGSVSGIMEIYPLKFLVDSPLYSQICRYNTLRMLFIITALKETQTKGLK